MARAEAKYVLTAEDRTGQAFESVKTRFRTAARTAARVGAGIGAAGAAGFAAMARDAINAADEIGKLSRELGVSTQNLSEMQGVLDLTGGTFDQYTQGIRRMQRAVVDAQDGSAAMAETFDALGLSVENLAAMSPEQQLDAMLRGLEGVSSETERNARAQELFGRSAQSMLRLVTTGADEVARLREEQRELGLSMDEDTTSAAERFNDAMSRLQQTFRGAVLQTVATDIDDIAQGMESIVRIVPPIIRGFAAVANLVSGAGEFIGATVAAGARLAQGDVSGASAAMRDFFAEDAEVNAEMVEEQRQTNEILRDVAREGMVGRAG